MQKLGVPGKRFASCPNLNTLRDEMHTLADIKTAIEGLDTKDRAILTAELFAYESQPDVAVLEAALQRGLDDVAAGRVHSVEKVRAMIPRWATGS
jgi:predicted transcriptional regulator